MSVSSSHGSITACRCRILSLDGGGVRGILTGVLIARLAHQFPDFLNRYVDVIAGTSTGGILALMMAYGYSPAECASGYKEHIPAIFSNTPSRAVNPFSAKYSGETKAAAFRAFVGDSRMKDLHHFVVIPSFMLHRPSAEQSRAESQPDPGGATSATFFQGSHWRPALFSNIPKAHGRVDPDMEVLVRDVASRTSAAPTYFPIHQGYVDGGVYANNPTMCAVAKVAEHYMLRTRDIAVLSVGAGQFNYNIDIKDKNPDWGVGQWVPYLAELLLQSQNMANDMQLNMMLGDRYHRLDCLLERDIPLDSVDDLDELVERAMQLDIEPAIRFIQEHFAGGPNYLTTQKHS